jgi:hypothetical protein
MAPARPAAGVWLPPGFSADGSYVLPYSIWDTAVYTPGRPFDEILFPLPTPREFTIDSLGLVFPPELESDRLAEIVRTVSLSLEFAAGQCIDAPLFAFPAWQPSRLPVPLCCSADNPLRIRLYGLEVDGPAGDPVPIQLVLRGAVLISPHDRLSVS